jgi:hypothetical protein
MFRGMATGRCTLGHRCMRTTLDRHDCNTTQLAAASTAFKFLVRRFCERAVSTFARWSQHICAPQLAMVEAITARHEAAHIATL